MVPHGFYHLQLITKAQRQFPENFEIRAQMWLSFFFFFKYTTETVLGLSFMLVKMNLGMWLQCVQNFVILQARGLSDWNLG